MTDLRSKTGQLEMYGALSVNELQSATVSMTDSCSADRETFDQDIVKVYVWPVQYDFARC